MTDDHGSDDVDHPDGLGDELDIDAAARENPPPGSTSPAEPPADPPTPASGVEPTAPAAESDPTTPGADVGRRRRGKDRKRRRKAPWWELPALVILAIVIAILVKTFLFQPFYIPSESMEKTLHGCPGCSGDRILVSKIIYDFRDPEPGDIVVFNAPNGWDDEPPSTPPSNPVLRAIRGFGQLIGFVPPDGLVLVKRVIAVGGQTVKGTRNGDVFISDHGSGGPWRKLDEPYKYETGPDYRARFGPVTVPKGRLWVMGDHRDRSADSRYHCGDGGADGPDNSSCNVTAATVPVSAVIGKAVLIVWPPSRWTTLGTPQTFEQGAAALTGTGLLPVAFVAPLFLIVRRKRRK